MNRISEAKKGSRSTSPVFCVGLRHRPVEVREPDKAVEVGNGNWFRIDWINRGRGKHVIRPAENGRTTGDGNGRE